MGAVHVRKFQVAFASSQVDATNRVIRGVAVMSVGEVLGHDCHADLKTLKSVRDCAAEYNNGVKVRVDHGSGVLAIIGAMRGFRIEDNVLRGDLHFFESATEAPRILELAKEIPDTFGLSISFSGPDEKLNKKDFARCEELFAVDLVPEPAANPTGLFSTKTTMANEDEEKKDPNEELMKRFEEIDERVKKLETPEEKKEDLEDEEKKEDLEEKPAEEVTKEEYDRLMKNHREMGARLEAIGTLRKFSKPATSAPEVKKPESETKNFEALVEETMTSKKLSKTEAISFCVKKYPTEHQEFIASGKTRVL